jgi:hypothetical protein
VDCAGSPLHQQLGAFMTRPYNLLSQPLLRMEVRVPPSPMFMWHLTAHQTCVICAPDAHMCPEQAMLPAKVLCAAAMDSRQAVPHLAGQHASRHHGRLVDHHHENRAGGSIRSSLQRRTAQLAAAPSAVCRLRRMAAVTSTAQRGSGMVDSHAGGCAAAAGAAI